MKRLGGGNATLAARLSGVPGADVAAISRSASSSQRDIWIAAPSSMHRLSSILAGLAGDRAAAGPACRSNVTAPDQRVLDDEREPASADQSMSDRSLGKAGVLAEDISMASAHPGTVRPSMLFRTAGVPAMRRVRKRNTCQNGNSTASRRARRRAGFERDETVARFGRDRLRGARKRAHSRQ